MESKETKEEKEFYEWAQKTLEISREKIAKNERLSKACETVIDAACNNRIEYGDNKIVYKLKHPVGDIKEVTFKTRLKYKHVQAIQSCGADVAAQKLFEYSMELPAAIIGELDIRDITPLSDFFGFLI